MKNFDRSTIIYSLNVEDLQTVALQEIGRELSEDEMEKVTGVLSANIGWYDAIASAIQEKIKIEEFL